MSDKSRRIVTNVVVPSVLTLALIAAAFYSYEQTALAEDYKNGVEAMYSRAFGELADNMGELETALGKLRVLDTPEMSVLLLDDVWRLSGACVSLMGQIPSSHVDTYELTAFTTRLGEYARTLTKKALEGKPASDADRETLEALYQKCVAISRDLNDRIAIGDVPLEVITNDGYYMDSSAANAEGGEEQGGNGAGEGAGNGGARSEEDIAEFPTMIYDGPFSEASEKAEPLGLSEGEVTMEEAGNVAYNATLAAELTSEGESAGTIPAYDFHGKLEDGREVDISVARSGDVIWFMSSSTGTREGVPDDESAKRYEDAALKWLAKQSYGEMRPTYAQYYAGAALINFACVDNGAIIYNDLVKIWVDVETLSIVGVDARGYLSMHRDRDIALPGLSLEEAEAMVSNNLRITARQLALIPLTPETECLAWEFRGTCGEDEYIVYIDCETGAEREVFVIVNTENGQLTQ